MCIQMLRVVLTCAVAVGAGSVYADAACVVDAFDVGAYCLLCCACRCCVGCRRLSAVL